MHAQTNEWSALVVPSARIGRDMMKAIKQGGGGVTSTEARYLVDLYYVMQKQRIATNNRVKGLDRDAEKSATKVEPHDAMDWTLTQFDTLEGQVARILGAYVEGHPMAWFFKATLGIGPVLAAGLLAHIDIKRCPTVGHLWNFAGLNPEVRWLSREQAKALFAEAPGMTLEARLTAAARQIGRNPENLLHAATRKPDGSAARLTEASAVAALSRKPFNGQLKTLAWKIGDSFVKLSGREDAYYGQLYRQRKAEEWHRNLAGERRAQASSALTVKRFGDATDAKQWYSGACDPAKARALLALGKPVTAALCLAEAAAGLPMLPPAHMDARARRYTVKLFLSHLHEVWWEQATGQPAPNPFAISMLGHAHYLPPPQRDHQCRHQTTNCDSASVVRR